MDFAELFEGALLDLRDRTQPTEHRILRGVEHLIRAQHHQHEHMEMKMTEIQDKLDALAKRIDDDTDAIQARLGQPTETVDTTALDASVARLDALAAPAASPEPVPTEPAAPANTSQFQPLYLVDGDANTDPAQWTQLAGYTTPDGRPLFTFAGDEAVVGAGATGDGVAGAWHLYSGELTVTS